MAINDPNDLDRIDCDIRINELKHEAAELTGGPMKSWESDECPPEISEQFWRNVVNYEKAPWTTDFERLTTAGIALPAPEALSDQQVTVKLWEVINKMAEMRTFLSQTDHLSDRELYAHLWHDSLREEHPDMSFDTSGAYHIDILGSGSEEDTQQWLQYYADEDARRRWAADYPDLMIPAHVDPPYDRDRRLPQRI